MAVNVPTVQLLQDFAGIVVVKVTGYYNATTSSNTKILQSNTLFGANTSQACIVSVKDVQYNMNLPSGFLNLQYANTAANQDIVILGGQAGGDLRYYMPNPTPQSGAGAGDINLMVSNALNNGSFTLLLTFNKEGDAGGGFANSYNAYNAPGYPN